jgi:hypothetical protein
MLWECLLVHERVRPEGETFSGALPELLLERT